MGLKIGQKNIELERRYSRLDLNKDMSSGSVTVRITYEDGYYDAGQWRTVDVNDVEVKGDVIFLLMGLTARQLKISQSGLGHLLDAAIYAVLSGKISLRNRLAVIVKDQKGNPLAASISISKDQQLYGQIYGAEAAFDLPVLFKVTLKVEAEGYISQTLNIPVLSGNVTREVVLEPTLREAQ